MLYRIGKSPKEEGGFNQLRGGVPARSIPPVFNVMGWTLDDMIQCLESYYLLLLFAIIIVIGFSLISSRLLLT